MDAVREWLCAGVLAVLPLLVPSNSALMIEWGGEVVNSEPDGEHTSAQMGSGLFPEEGFGKASYFCKIQVVDGSNNLRVPKGIRTFTE